MPAIKALIFDVFGTVVDWRGGVIRDVTQIAQARGADIDAARFADAWRSDYRPAMDLVRQGAMPWTKLDDLHRRTLDRLLEDSGLAGLGESERDWLNRCWHRLDPWPDVAEGIRRLKQDHVVAAFSNGNVSLLVGMAKRAGIPWDCIISAELFRHYKPDPEIYRGAVELLSLAPSEVMLVAAHNDDLCAAADEGLATAFVCRPGELGPSHLSNLTPAREYTCAPADLTDLAAMLGA
ncbi:MAG: haloacid dehalogenase type II [Streptosporangiaceae bacterium]|jgi:2-haloacid dehalogenase